MTNPNPHTLTLLDDAACAVGTWHLTAEGWARLSATLEGPSVTIQELAGKLTEWGLGPLPLEGSWALAYGGGRWRLQHVQSFTDSAEVPVTFAGWARTPAAPCRDLEYRRQAPDGVEALLVLCENPETADAAVYFVAAAQGDFTAVSRGPSPARALRLLES